MGANQWAQYAGSSYGVNPQFLLRIGHRESGNRVDAVNNWDINAKNGTPSEGPLQFIQPTFDSFARQAKAANPQAWRGVPLDWHNPQAQFLAGAWAFSTGKGSHWATYNDALRDVGGKLKGGRGKFALPAGVGQNSQNALGAAQGGTGSGGGSRRAMALSLLLGDDDVSTWDLIGLKRQGAQAAPEAPTLGSLGPQKVRGGGAIGSSWRDIQRLGNQWGLQNDPGINQLYGGRHSNGSEHYGDGGDPAKHGRAVDWGNARNTEAELRAAQARYRKLGYDVLWEGDHLHVSLPGSGV